MSYQDIIDRIELEMSLRNISKSEICRRLYVSDGTLRQWLSGNRSPKTTDLLQLLDELGLEIVLRGKAKKNAPRGGR